MKKAMWLLVFAACGGGSGGSAIDAARLDAPADVRLPDAAVDGPADVPADSMFDAGPIATTHHGYVVDSQQVPLNNTQARAMGFDLNNDGVVDNQYGMVLATLGSMGFDLQAATTRDVDRGVSISLIDLVADSFTNEPHAGVTLGIGADPMPAACTSANDTVCRHHLAGTGMFTTTPTNGPLLGNILSGTLAAGPGTATVPLGMVVDAAPVAVDLIGARVQITAASATSLGMVKIGGAISQTDIDTKVYPAMRDGFEKVIARDCTALSSPPTCGCASGSSGSTFVQLFDTNHDCAVSLAEVQSNSLLMSLFAPDVTINGVPGLSYGYTATAVKATF